MLRADLAQGALDHDLELGGFEGFEAEHAAARQEGGDDLEGRVLGGGPDQSHRAVLDVRQDGVLLRLVEAVDLVDEKDRAQPGAAVNLGLGHLLAKVGDAGRDG